MEVKVIVRGEIKTKQRPRARIMGGFAQVYTPKDTINYENYIRSEYMRQCNDYSFKDKPLAVIVDCYFKANKTLEALGEDVALLPCKTHKDLDNICKLVDALNGIAWEDDKQIIQLSAYKQYTLDNERLEITIVDLSDEFKYQSVEDIRTKRKIDKLEQKKMELCTKPKLTKAEQDRLVKIMEELREYGKTN